MGWSEQYWEDVKAELEREPSALESSGESDSGALDPPIVESCDPWVAESCVNAAKEQVATDGYVRRRPGRSANDPNRSS